jgi:two-component system, NarL family, nitrate/nitrite response regulator NarL
MRAGRIGETLHCMLMRCVIVDDNESFIDVARTFLEQDGLSVVGVAATAAEALRQVETLRPDVVLIDIFLGKESGLELVARLRGAGDERALILISTHTETDVSDLITESGADGFVAKAQLSADAVRRVVNGRPR